jgi:hypothetical protein
MSVRQPQAVEKPAHLHSRVRERGTRLLLSAERAMQPDLEQL